MISGPAAFVQCALLFTSSNGERRIRYAVHGKDVEKGMLQRPCLRKAAVHLRNPLHGFDALGIHAMLQAWFLCKRLPQARACIWELGLRTQGDLASRELLVG